MKSESVNGNQKNIKTKLTPEQKLQQSVYLYNFARKLKETSLKQFHPDWTDEQIKQKLKELFLYART